MVERSTEPKIGFERYEVCASPHSVRWHTWIYRDRRLHSEQMEFRCRRIPTEILVLRWRQQQTGMNNPKTRLHDGCRLSGRRRVGTSCRQGRNGCHRSAPALSTDSRSHLKNHFSHGNTRNHTETPTITGRQQARFSSVSFRVILWLFLRPVLESVGHLDDLARGQRRDFQIQ